MVSPNEWRHSVIRAFFFPSSIVCLVIQAWRDALGLLSIRPVARIFFGGGVRSLERKGYFFLGGGEASTGV